MPRVRHALGSLGLGLMMACRGGGGDGSSNPAPPPPPTGLTLAGGPTFDQVEARWTPPAAVVDGYVFEGRVDSGAFETIPGVVPGDALGVLVEMIPTTPELVTLGARMRALRAGAYSVYSNEATFFRGLRPPADLRARRFESERYQLTWTAGSTAAAGLQVERSRYDDPSATFGPFTPVATVPLGSTSFLDDQGLELGRSYQYRIRYVATHAGTPVESLALTETVDERLIALPPTDLQVTSLAGAPHLTWINHSVLASALHVRRCGGWTEDPFAPTLLATLPPTASTFDDAIQPPGLYTYRVAAEGSASEPAWALLPPPGLAASAIQLPRGPALDRDANGRWWAAMASDPYFAAWPTLTLWAPVPGGWSPHVLTLPAGSLLAEPGLLLDGAGRPHVIYLRALPNGTTAFPSELIHTWYEGSAWQEEVVATRTFASHASSPEVWFALAPDGSPRVVWRNGGYDLSPELARKDAGIWTVAPLTTPLLGPGLDFQPRVACAPDGTLYLAFASGGALVLRTVPPAGPASEESVTTGPFQDLHLLLPHEDGVVLACARYVHGEEAPFRTLALVKTGGTWAPPLELQAFDTSSTGQPWRGTARGGRVAFVVPTPVPDGLWCHRWQAGPGWTTVRLREHTGWERNTLLLDAGAHLTVLSPGAPTSADLRTYALYTEP